MNLSEAIQSAKEQARFHSEPSCVIFFGCLGNFVPNLLRLSSEAILGSENWGTIVAIVSADGKVEEKECDTAAMVEGVVK